MASKYSRRGFGRIAAFSFGALTVPNYSLADTVVPDRIRDIPLSAGWQFGPVGGTSVPVTLPHSVVRQSWELWDPASWEKQWQYQNVFDALFYGARYFLHFSAALTSATVVLNGHELGTHAGGYLPFEYEITEWVRARGNQLKVLLDGGFDIDVPPDRPGQPSNSVDYWQLAGLYRDVVLKVVPQAYLADVFAVPRNVLDPAKRRVEVSVTVDGAVTEGRLEIRLLDGSRTVGSATVPAGNGTVTSTIGGLNDITLWDIDQPKLYQLSVRLFSGARQLHEYTVQVGFRQAEFTKSGFFLNGRKTTLFGVNRHQFYPFVGAAMPPRVQRRDAQILKELNCSMVRCSHYPQHEAFLDACDELGILVFTEAPGWGYLGDDQWQDLVIRDVHDLIVRDRNHPSVVLWGVRLNETPADAKLYTRTQRLARELDDSRQTTGAILGSDYATDDFQQDVFGYNDYDSQTGPDGVRLPVLKAPRTDYPTLVTESVGTLSGPGIYYRRTDPVTDQHGQALAHALVHEQAAADPRYCGALGWSGFDYPSGTGNQYQGVKYTGVVDQFRVPKLGAAVYAAQVDPRRKVVIEPAFYWDFGGEFSVRTLGADALIFANADRLECFVGNAPFATLYPDRTRFGHLRYPPFAADFSTVAGSPELRIVAYLGARRIGTRVFSADRGADRLVVQPDDLIITADGVDATRVVVRVVDRYGAPAPANTGTVRFTLDGHGELIGDNPFPLGETGGVAAVWLRSIAGRPGILRLRAEHDTLVAVQTTVVTRGSA